MCGIIVGINHNGGAINKQIGAIYEAQKGRGRSGFGLVEITDTDLFLKRFTEEDDTLKELEKSQAHCILMHHRIPTSTDNNVNSNHPMFTDWDGYKHRYYLIHNGHIQNWRELKLKHEQRGIKYNTFDGQTFTDSEALLHEVALVIEGIITPGDFVASGSMAFIMMQTDRNNNPTALYYGRNISAPLKLNNTDGVITLSSEAAVGNFIEPNKLFRYDVITKETTSQDVIFGMPEYSVSVAQALTYTKRNTLASVLNCVYDGSYVYRSDIKDMGLNDLRTLHIVLQHLLAQNKIAFETMMFCGNKQMLQSIEARNTALMYAMNLVIEEL